MCVCVCVCVCLCVCVCRENNGEPDSTGLDRGGDVTIFVYVKNKGEPDSTGLGLDRGGAGLGEWMLVRGGSRP